MDLLSFPSYIGNFTIAVIIMIVLVLLYTTGKLLTSPIQVGIGTVIAEYIPLCLWTIVAYRLIKYDQAVWEGQIPTHPSRSVTLQEDDYEDRVSHMRDVYYDQEDAMFYPQ